MRLPSGLLGVAWLAGGVLAAEPDAGARLYAEQCSGCHGVRGEGDGPQAPALVPKPRNFRDPAFWRDRTVEQLKVIVRRGKPGTMMPPFEGVLTAEQMDAVVAFVRRFDPAAAK
jgi:mono/diheme cytochrome c family protein